MANRRRQNRSQQSAARRERKNSSSRENKRSASHAASRSKRTSSESTRSRARHAAEAATHEERRSLRSESRAESSSRRPRKTRKHEAQRHSYGQSTKTGLQYSSQSVNTTPGLSLRHYGVKGTGGSASILSRNNLFAKDGLFGQFGFASIIIAAIALFFVLVQLVSCLAGSLTPAKLIYGTGGITTSPLYQASNTTFQADLLIPKIFAPRRPGMATITGTKRDPGSAGDQLSQAIYNIKQNGYEVGFALYDVNTGISITYNADSAFYSASSIKGPYVVSLVRYELGSSASSESKRISNILLWSDNDSYSSLRDAYGDSCFASLANASGATSIAATGATEDIQNAMASQSGSNGTAITDNKYEFYSANQLLALWRESYSFLTSSDPGAEWLTEQFDSPEISAISTAASSIGTTWSKAGWYPEEAAGYGTTVDAGVIRTNTGDVVLAVLTNDPEDFATLESIVSPLLAMRAALTN